MSQCFFGLAPHLVVTEIELFEDCISNEENIWQRNSFQHSGMCPLDCMLSIWYQDLFIKLSYISAAQCCDKMREELFT